MHLSIEGSGIVFEAAKVVDFDSPRPHMYFLVDEKLSRTRNPLHSTTMCEKWNNTNQENVSV